MYVNHFLSFKLPDNVHITCHDNLLYAFSQQVNVQYISEITELLLDCAVTFLTKHHA